MEQQRNDVRQHAIDLMHSGTGAGIEASELHHELFNTDYFIIGTYRAKQWLGDQAFEAIAIIKEYEQQNFGEVSTDLSDPEKVANMLAYVLGEELLTDSPTLMDFWDKELDEENIAAIIEEMI